MDKERTTNSNKARAFVNSLLLVSGSNIFQLGANIALGLLIPMLLSVEEYGYYKIYTLYIGYCGVLHFGFVDGILLNYGGQDIAQLDRFQFRGLTKVFCLCELLCVCLIIVLGISFFDGIHRVIVLLVGCNLLITNMTLYYQYLTQAVSRFKTLSLRKVLNALLTILLVATFWLYKEKRATEVGFEAIVVGLQLISLGLLFWYVWTYRDLSFGKSVSLQETATRAWSLCQKGILLTIAYEIAQFMLLLDRQLVSVLFPVETYAQYAFAYNLLSCVTTVIAAMSTVMFPMLKRMSVEKVKTMFSDSIAAITMLICAALGGYYIVALLVEWILPAYIDAMRYFRIVFPALAMSGSITIVMFTFYKVLDKIRYYLVNSLITLAVCLGLGVCAYWLWRTPEAISCASVAAITIWYCLNASRLAKFCQSRWTKNLLYVLIIMLIFYVSTYLNSPLVGFVIYYIGFIVMTYIWYGRNLTNIVKRRHLK